ncbi:Ankyrin repeat and protein kinase domain-containing protein 1 (Protein kinase PKK2) (Sugen kinase 288) (SgK288) (X-kinase) [Durusdinium trenchii]|uniref:Ankyrin repeat and protein kinase domain-containing protein 1 (Protein kinase PKK2) (Sugen kinase 288) (SgK288) (X-kinase) n=1 Tax=Durusdinium trenchii TaxID=1381693 RepID=A0ABP0P1G4_9DINO
MHFNVPKRGLVDKRTSCCCHSEAVGAQGMETPNLAFRHQEQRSQSALHRAAINGEVDELQRALGDGIDIEATDEDGWTSLHLAALKGHLSVVERLLEVNANLEAVGMGGDRPLHLAAQNGHGAVLACLVAAGAALEARAELTGRTSLHRAAAKGHSAAAQWLVDARADVEAKDDNGETPFELATKRDQRKVMAVLCPVYVCLPSGRSVPCDPSPDRQVCDLRKEAVKKLQLKGTEILEMIGSSGEKLHDHLSLQEAGIDYGGCVSAIAGKYDLQDPQKLIQFLLDAKIGLIRLEYLEELLSTGRRLPRRQEADGEVTAAGLPALVLPSELQKVEIDPIGNMSICVKDPSPHRVTVVIESISHAWESMEHPDPHGFQLDQIIQMCPPVTSTRSVWLFYDFTSLYQYGGRTPQQKRYFKQALDQMHTLYAHEAIKVRILDELTPETWKHPGTVMAFSDQAGGVIAVSIDQLTANSIPYLLRGWCQAERQWSRLRISLEACVPMPPDLFRRKMEEQGLRFTHHDDKEAVLKLQAQVFTEKVRTTKQLMAENLDEEALNTLCAALPFYVDLDEIVVNGNVLPRNAAVAVANTNARSFQMESCGLKDEDVEVIVASLLHCNKVEELRLARNDIGHRGLQALRELRKAKPDLYIDVQLDDQEARDGYSLNASTEMTPETAN